MLLPHRHLGQSGPYLLLVHGYMVDGGMFMAVEEGFLRHYRLLIPISGGMGMRGTGQGRTRLRSG